MTVSNTPTTCGPAVQGVTPYWSRMRPHTLPVEEQVEKGDGSVPARSPAAVASGTRSPLAGEVHHAPRLAGLETGR